MIKKQAVWSFIIVALSALPVFAQGIFYPPSTTAPQETRPRTAAPVASPSSTPKTGAAQQSQPTQSQQPRPTPAASPQLTPAAIAPAASTKPASTNTNAPASNFPSASDAVPPAAGAAQTITVPSLAAPINAPVIPLTLLAHPLSVNKIRARQTEAQRLLKSRPMLTSMPATPSLYSVTLAVLDPDSSQIHLLYVSKQTFLTRGAEAGLISSLGTPLRLRVLRANGVNTAVTVSDNNNRALVPLIVEYPIERNGVFREMAHYTSAHPTLLSPELVKAGQSYVHTMLDAAAKRLLERGVVIAPNIIDVAERLCIVEHTDHDRFRTEGRSTLFDEIYSLYALNELDTYRYSVSFAGAGGMVQMIPATYQMERQRHPGVGLNPDFVAGMRNHGNALEAMLLYMQDTWNDMAFNPDITYALSTKIATFPELLAAGYNSNPARLGAYIQRGGASWRSLIPRETQTYLQIYNSVNTLVPMKPRSGS
ncbi:MAG: hypothetical protein ACR2LC_17385 [Pyrinomonadaceae bacterium]